MAKLDWQWSGARPETWQAWSRLALWTVQRQGERWVVLLGGGWLAHFPTREEAQQYCQRWEEDHRG